MAANTIGRYSWASSFLAGSRQRWYVKHSQARHSAITSNQNSAGKATAKHLAQQVLERCRKLATFSEDSGRLRRTFLSPPMRQVHQEVTSWLKPLGTDVRVDAVG